MSQFRMSKAAAGALLLLLAGGSRASAQDADIAQIVSVPGGVAGIVQQGDRNQASIDQRAVASGAVDLQNHALISQTGDANKASIEQEGSSNNAAITQDGSQNAADIWQQHSGNSAEVQQSGNGLGIKIEQFGAGTPGTPITIKQFN
jgi:minor curlin subunit